MKSNLTNRILNKTTTTLDTRGTNTCEAVDDVVTCDVFFHGNPEICSGLSAPPHSDSSLDPNSPTRRAFRENGAVAPDNSLTGMLRGAARHVAIYALAPFLVNAFLTN